MTDISLISLTVKSSLGQALSANPVQVRVGIDSRLDTVIAEFCTRTQLPRLPSFALQSDLQAVKLSLDLTVAAAGLADGDVIYIFNTAESKVPVFRPPERAPTSPTLLLRDSVPNWWIFAGFTLAIGVIGLVIAVVIYSFANRQVTAYGIVIDAGSSSSKVYVYTWPAAKTDGNGVLTQVASDSSSNAPIESSQGISQIEKSLRSVASAVPDDRRGSTPLYLGATAGMRLLETLNASAAATVMANARSRLTAGNFTYKVNNPSGQIRTVTGAEEGIGAWITVNYLKDSFGDFSTMPASDARHMAADSETFGGLDLGGASTQIAFIPAGSYVPAASTELHIVPLRLYGKSYGVYAYSFLCYGKSIAEVRHLAVVIAAAGYNNSSPVESPCFQVGYSEVVPYSKAFPRPCSDDWHLNPAPPPDAVGRNFTVRGTGNHSACAALVGAFFNATCDQTSCSFNDVFQPAPSGRFVAFSGFFYVAQFFNATSTSTVSWRQFDGAVRAFCGANYTSQPATAFLGWYCFDGFYVLSLLGAFGFNETNWNRLEFADTITVNHTTAATPTTIKVGWFFGYLIQQSGLMPSEYPVMPYPMGLFVFLVVLFCLLLLLTVVFFCMAVRIMKSARGFSV